MVGGVAFGLGQYVCSNFISVELTDIVASLLSAGSMVLFLRVWQPAEPVRGDTAGAPGRPAIAGAAAADPAHEAAVRRREGTGRDTRGDVFGAYAPYLIIIVVFGIAQWGPIKDWLDGLTKAFQWPGLHILTTKGKAPSSVTFKFNWANAAGTLLLVSGLLTMAILRVSPGRGVRLFGETVAKLKWATLTVASVLALAYVMNDSAQTITIGSWIAGAGGVLGLLSPLIGWIGVAGARPRKVPEP